MDRFGTSTEHDRLACQTHFHQAGSKVRRGEELGYFAYGGSTVVAILEPGMVEWDSDLVANSAPRTPGKLGTETLMKVGWSIGKAPRK